MKRMWILTVFLCAMLMGCNSEDEMKGEAQIIGTVIEIRSASFLVEEEDSEVVWVNVPEEDSSNYEVGQEVFVWTDGSLMESDPPQANALHIEVVDDEVNNEEQTLKIQKRIGDENNYEDSNLITDHQKVQQAWKIVENVKWEKAKVQMDIPPDYRFSFPNAEAKVIVYQVWITPNKDGLELTYANNQFAKLSKEHSAKLFEILTGEKLTD